MRNKRGLPYDVCVEAVYALFEQLSHGSDRLRRQHVCLIPNDAMRAQDGDVLC